MNDESAENITQRSADGRQISDERRDAGWDLKNAFGNYSVLAGSQIVAAFFSFASVWFATRYLGTEGYGGIVAIIAASQVVQIFVNWSAASVIRFGTEEFVTAGEINKSFWSRIFIFAPNTLLLLVSSPWWFPYLAKLLKLPMETFWLVILHFLVLAFWLHVQFALQGAKLPRIQAVLIAVERFLIFAVLFGLFVIGELTWLTALWAYIFASFSMIFAGLWHLRSLLSWKISFDADWLKRMLKFSVPLIPFALVGYFSSGYLDAIFISQYFSKSDLGIYSIASQVNGILMQFPTLVGALLLPWFVTLQTNNQDLMMKSYMEDILPLITLLGEFVFIFIIACAYYLLPLFFGAEAFESSKVLLILGVSAVVGLPHLMGYASFINAASATYIGTAMAIVGAIVNLTANAVLIPRYGLIGCAWATVLAYGTSLLTMMIIVHWRFPLKHKWTLQALFPSIISALYFSWSGNLVLTLAVFVSATICLLILYYNAIKRSSKLLWKFLSKVAGKSFA
jgi:O-antigen/teichoic acid export membrane protein